MMSVTRNCNLRSERKLNCALSFALLLAAFAATPAVAATNSALATAVDSITDNELYHHVEVLADDVFEGRAAGSRGGHAAAKYVLDQIKNEGLTPAGDKDGYVQSFEDDCRNILLLRPGDDPFVEKEVIVVGAHYDHVGYGKRRNSFGPVGEIHNGADDNASGTSLLLEMIQAFSISGLKTRRSILFAFWDGEENGLVGSRYWIAHPTVPLDRVKLDITIDMVGRLRDERLLVLGTRSGYGLRRLFSDAADEPLWLDFSWDLSANSDHWPFLEHNIPVALIHTGLHSDYHRPTDDVEKINRVGMGEVGRYLLMALIKVADEDHLPTFRGAVRRETEKMRRALEQPLPLVSLANWPAGEPRLRLGITWREDDAEPGSVFLTRVVKGSPAETAGLQPGDRIDVFDGQPFADGAALRTAINAQLDAGHPKLNMLVERRGHVRTVTLKTDLKSQESRVESLCRRRLNLLRRNEQISLRRNRTVVVRVAAVYTGGTSRNPHGDVAELADALDLGSSSFTGVEVQILSSPLFVKRFFASALFAARRVLPEVLSTAIHNASVVASASWPT
jgi:Peptidase family M28/PDZ domain